MAEKRLDIIVRARNAVREGFAQARSEAQRFGKEIGASTGGNIEKTVQLVANVSKAAIAFNAINAATAAMQGNWEEMDTIMRRMPLGLGQIYQEIHGIIGAITGLSQAIKDLQEDAAANAKEWAENKKQLLEGERAADRLRAMYKQVRDEARLATAEDKDAAAIYARFEQGIASISQLGAFGEAHRQLAEQIEGELRARLARELAELDRKRKEEADKAAAAAQRKGALARISELGAEAAMIERGQIGGYAGVAGLEVSSRYQGIGSQFAAKTQLDQARNSKLESIYQEIKAQRQVIEQLEAKADNGGGIVVGLN